MVIVKRNLAVTEEASSSWEGVGEDGADKTSPYDV